MESPTRAATRAIDTKSFIAVDLVGKVRLIAVQWSDWPLYSSLGAKVLSGVALSISLSVLSLLLKPIREGGAIKLVIVSCLFSEPGWGHKALYFRYLKRWS